MRGNTTTALGMKMTKTAYKAPCVFHNTYTEERRVWLAENGKHYIKWQNEWVCIEGSRAMDCMYTD